MAEELEGLLERIQNDTVTKAEQQAEEIIAKAKDKAAGIVKEAREQAKQALEKAEKDAEAFTQRSTKTLEQAARDLIITVGSGVESLFTRLVKDAVGQTLSGDVVAKLLEQLCSQADSEAMVLSVSPDDAGQVTAHFKAQFAEALKEGRVTIQTDNEIIKGFTVGLKGQDVYTDFSGEAIAEALMKFLRPQLAEIVRTAAGQN